MILGFDGLRAGALTRCCEVNLFRMAFDTIANAVGRINLEQEKERLEANLLQARRMETIGAFACRDRTQLQQYRRRDPGPHRDGRCAGQIGAPAGRNLAGIRRAGGARA